MAKCNDCCFIYLYEGVMGKGSRTHELGSGDEATDLRLDYASNTADSASVAHRDVGIQCDIREIAHIGADLQTDTAAQSADWRRACRPGFGTQRRGTLT